jgi:molybdate transport system ATP-binding protein
MTRPGRNRPERIGPTGEATLNARVVIRYPRLTIDVTLLVDAGEVVGVSGPNGAGKTTVLRAVAGLEAIDDGRIAIGGVVVDEPGAGLHVPPARRHVGLVFQDHRLFPQMTALENIAFGMRAAGVERPEARRRAQEWLDRVGLTGLADHRPGMLSGGQSQRVALARALAAEPDVLLLDEPLAAIDASSRDALRDELRRHLASFPGPVLLVSHLAADLEALTTRTIAMAEGRLV